MFLSGSSPAHGGHRREPADVAVVVGAEQVDAAVEAALALVDVVGECRRRSRSARRCDRISTRSLSSPKSVVRIHSAPSAS